jgi:hypothetical protein
LNFLSKSLEKLLEIVNLYNKAIKPNIFLRQGELMLALFVVVMYVGFAFYWTNGLG